MANELQAYTTTGKTLYAVLISSAGQAWNGATFEAIQSGNWTTYDIALTEATAGLYLANLPAVIAGIYSYVVYEQAGGTPAITDTKLGVGYLNWDGTAILPLSTVDTVADAILVDTGTTIPGTITTMQADLDNPDQYKADVSALALEATLTAIKGAGWSDETLVALMTAIEAISAGSGATAQEVWEYATRALTTPADYKADISILPTAATIWAHATRTLTNQGTSVESPIEGDPLEIYRDTTVVVSLTGLGNVSGYTNIWFTVKEDLDDADTESIIQIDRTTGLLYIDGVEPTTSAEGSIVFSDETAGSCTITIVEEAAADLPLYSTYPIYWDMKMLKDGNVTILSKGEMYIYGTPTRAIV